MYLNAMSSLQELGNKIISVGMPILIGIAVVIAIIMVAYYGIAGKLAIRSKKICQIDLQTKNRLF